MKRYKTVDDYLEGQAIWQTEIKMLRKLICSTRLEECVKWGGPVYTINGKNVVGLGGFKQFVSLWFFQGALLSDPLNKLVNAQEGVTKALRQWRFTGTDGIDSAQILGYLEEAISNQERGIEIKALRSKPLIIPPELSQSLKKDASLQTRFESFTLSKKREFTDYISEAKREVTKEKRMQKIIPLIMSGVGLHDKYRK